jgi:hypothetical protein
MLRARSRLEQVQAALSAKIQDQPKLAFAQTVCWSGAKVGLFSCNNEKDGRRKNKT